MQHKAGSPTFEVPLAPTDPYSCNVPPHPLFTVHTMRRVLVNIDATMMSRSRVNPLALPAVFCVKNA